LSSSSNPFAKINLIVPAKLNEESEKTSEKSLLGDETPLMNQGNSKSEHEVTESRLTVDAEKASQDKDVDTKGNTDNTTLDENEKEKNIFDKDAAPSNVLNEESPKGNEDNWGANSVETENKDTGTSIKAARDETVNEGAEREPVTIAEKQGVEDKDKSEPTAPLSSFQQLSSSQNAFTGLSGTFSFGSLSKDGPAFGSGSGSLFGVQFSEKSAFSIVRVAIIAGTLHPNPIMSGINDFPCSPILCISLSIIKAARAIYPVSSINEIKKNRIKILGKNTITPPIPLITPSISKSLNTPAVIILSRVFMSSPTPFSIQFMGYCPNEKVD